MQEAPNAFSFMLLQNGNRDRLPMASSLLGATGWIDCLTRLVSIGSCEGEAQARIADLLRDMFAPLGMSFRRVTAPVEGDLPPPATMLATRRTGRRPCTFYFPIDIPPAGEGWTRAPFALTRRGSRLYGRGTAEVKGAIAAVWAALRAADAVGLELGIDPVLLFCADPRIGHHSALRHCAAEGMVEGHVVSLNGTMAPRIWTASPGTLHLSVVIRGVGGAGNPVEASMPVLERLAELRAAVAARGFGLTPGRPRPGEADTSDLPICEIPLERTFRMAEEVPDIVVEVDRAVRTGLADGMTAEIRVAGQTPPVVDAHRGANGARWQQSLRWGFGFPGGRFRPWSGALTSPLGYVQQAGVQEILLGGLRRPSAAIGAADEFTTVEDVEALARSLLAYLSDINELPAS